MPEWFVFLGPVLLLVAQFFAARLTHKFVRKDILNGELSDDEEKLSNMYVSVYGFFLSLIVLIIISLIYSRFAPGLITAVAAWIITPACFITMIFAHYYADKLINPLDFGKGQGVEILETTIQTKSRLNWIRIGITIISFLLAILTYLSAKNLI